MAAIDQKINLIGVPQVTQGIDQIVAKTKEATAAVNNIGSGAGAAVAEAANPIQVFNVSLKNTATAMHETESAGRGVAEMLHILHPVAAAAGIELGNLGQFARLASAGFVGLGAAVTGAVAAKLIELSDAADKAKGKLGDLLGNQAAGQSAFGRLSEDAEKLGTSTEALLPAFTSLIRAGQDLSSIHFFAAPGQELPELISGTKQASDAVNALFTVLRAGHASLDEANKTTGDFANALQQAGALTKQVASILLPFPKAFDALKAALGASGQSTKQFLDNLDKAPASFQRVQSALSQISAQIPQSFDPKAPQSLKDAIEELWTAVKEGAQIDRPKAFEQMIADLAPKVKQIAHDIAQWAPPAVSAIVDFGREVAKIAENTKQDITNLKTYGELFKILFTTTDMNTFLDTLKKIRDTSREIGQTGIVPGQALDILKKKFQETQDAAKSAGDEVDNFKSRWDAMSQDVQQKPLLPKGFVTAPTEGRTVPPPGSVFAPTGDQAAAGPSFRAAPAATPQLFKPEDVKSQIEDLGSIMDDAFAKFDFSGLSDSLDKAATDAGQSAAQIVDQAFQDLQFTGVTSSFDTAMSTIVQKAQEAWDRIIQIFSQQLPQPSGGGFSFSGTPLAGGGLVRGPGTGTSDSIPAWLSNSEFVLTAASTKFWGQDLLNWMNKAPRFAAGGVVSTQTSAVHLHFDGSSFALQASEDVASALRKHAVKSRLLSTGRKPSWY